MKGKKNVTGGPFASTLLITEKGVSYLRWGSGNRDVFRAQGHSDDLTRGKENRRYPAWQKLGGISFFLSSSRVATAVELDDVGLVSIINDISILMKEFLK